MGEKCRGKLDLPHTDNFLPCTYNDSNHNDYRNNNSLNHALIAILVLNCQSLLAKKESLFNLISLHNPGIIMGCESWLKPEVKNGKIFINFHPIIMFTGQTILMDVEVYLYHVMTLLLPVTYRLKHPLNYQHV